VKPVGPVDQTSRLRVLFLIGMLGPAGAERQARYLLTNLPNAGVDVRLGTFGGYEGELARVSAAGIPIHRLMPRPPGLWPARLFVQLHGILWRHRIRIVHTFLPTFDILGPCLRLVDPSLRVITSRRSLDDYLSWRDLKLLRRTGHLATHIVGNSQAVLESVSRLEGFQPPQVRIIPNGLEIQAPLTEEERARARADLGLAPRAFVVSLPAHFRRGKGHALIPKIAQVVCREVPQADFLLVGDMEVNKQYREIAATLRRETAALGLADRVRCLGPRLDLRMIHAASDVSINLSESEGMSNSLMEAMALGLAAVATAVGGNLEVLTDGADGLHVPRGDAAASAAALLRLARDPELRRSLGAAARNRMIRDYSIERMVARYVDLYREVTGKRL